MVHMAEEAVEQSRENTSLQTEGRQILSQLLMAKIKLKHRFLNGISALITVSYSHNQVRTKTDLLSETGG